MKILTFVFAIIFLITAHILKVKRQKQFIEIYEKPNEKYLLQGLSIGYILNIILPFKLGTVFRVIYPGKKMENGVSFSLSTVLIDIILDFFSIFIIYLVLFVFNFNVYDSLIHYLIICSIIICGLIISFVFNKFVKNIILKIASIFNDSIELKLLKTSWFTITSFKDMLSRISKLKLLLYTIGMWFLYVGSYILLGSFFVNSSFDFKFIDIFNIFYSLNGLSIPMIYLLKNSTIINIGYLISYILVPIILLYIISYVYKLEEVEKEYVKILPHINLQDRLSFLVAYFNADNRDYFKTYIQSNNDVAIIEDYSAGSNATTMLCNKDGKMFFRKYSFGSDAKKLYDQVLWLEKHQKNIKLTTLQNVKYNDNYCSYDMPYNSNAVTCFNYVHTVPINKAWSILEAALNDISNNLHTLNNKKAKKEIIYEYIDTKVLKNIEKIENGKYIKPLIKYDYIYINGKKLKNLSMFKKYLNREYLYNIFKNDKYSDIHGDFTIENIICLKNDEKNGYYIIDPNTGNLHDCPYLDYAKLLQSIHGGYEFLMNTKNVEFRDNKIDFLCTNSSVYEELFCKFKNYLENKFDNEGVKSIFFHEIIHWLRLMPYKIEKNKERSVIFYAGLIKVLNDVEEMYLKKDE